jgi:hypothetical protein
MPDGEFPRRDVNSIVASAQGGHFSSKRTNLFPALVVFRDEERCFAAHFSGGTGLYPRIEVFYLGSRYADVV